MHSEQIEATTKKAWAYSSVNGGVEKNLKLIDRHIPTWVSKPLKGKYAIEVLASSLNPVDYKLPISPIESRIARIPKPASPGLDFCGRIVAQPERVVFGRLPWPVQYGTLGPYVLATENDFVDLPEKISVEVGAAVPIAALTAYQSIVPFVQPGQRVVIVGGSGGVGTFGIQIAKLMGAYVVAVCSGRNEELCRQLGADQTVDYTKTDIVDSLANMTAFDLIVDNVGNDPTLHRRSQAFLNPTARFVLVSAMLTTAQGVLSMLESLCRPAWLGGPIHRYKIVLCQSNKAQLQQIARWIADGSVKVIIDQVFSFDEAPQAMGRLMAGRARGKIVVKGPASL
ncbi:hypothetical protein AMS68_005112 [Peltaster fructicola]|uniref:Enoyl reductase (ER) domain-containing protein n=1 Tax=Peltaster fructicola TaxID=286661 RepID=A0A6H0XY61_9PEZI|nr:hypothetical protein AMS68_005112 [Peltaster fructicola]